MNDFFGRILRWWGLRWSHVAMLYNGQVFETTFSTIRVRPFKKFIEENREWQLWRLKEPLTVRQTERLVSYAHGNVGKPYNYYWLLGLASYLLIQLFQYLRKK